MDLKTVDFTGKQNMAREYASEAPVASKREYAAEPSVSKDPFAELDKELERSSQVGAEQRRGAALPVLGAIESIPYEPIQKWAQGKITDIKKTPEMQGAVINPRTVGELGTYGATSLIPGAGALKATRALSTLPKFLARTGIGAAGGAATMGLTQPVEEGKDIGKEKLGAAKTGAVVGGVLSGTAPLVLDVAKKGYKGVKDSLMTAFGNDAKKLAEQLRTYASTMSGDEARVAETLARDAEQRAAQMEVVASTTDTAAERELSGLPGVTEAQEAGRLKPIPASTQSIGEKIKAQADKIYNSLKTTRSNNAEQSKGEAFGEALAKEKAGAKVKDTKAFKEALDAIKRAITNPDTKLQNVTGSAETQLRQIKNQLDPKVFDPVTQTVMGKDISFEGLEFLRRQLNDRAYGLPAEGFDAISQGQAGKLVKYVEKVQEEFSPKIRKFIDQYRKDSEPLRVFQSKIGKSLVDEQLLGSGTNYAKVAATDIPGRVFKNKDAYEGLIDALGGNKQFAEGQAQQHFARELEKLGGDPKAVEKYISQNRTMLDLTNSKKMVEDYLGKIRGVRATGEAAKKTAEQDWKTSTTQMGLKEDFQKLESQIITARDESQIARFNQDLANKLLSIGKINQTQYREMIGKTNEILNTLGASEEAKRRVYQAVGRIVGGGLVGAAGLYGAKQLGSNI